MKTGLCPLAIDKHHAFVKASFPISWLFPIAPIHEWAVFIKEKKTPILGVDKRLRQNMAIPHVYSLR